MSASDTILDAIVTELLDAGNSTGITAASHTDEPGMSRGGGSGSVTAYVFAGESEADHEANQYIFENQALYISLFGRNRAALDTASDVVKTLFYKATPLANLRTAGADFVLYERKSPPLGSLAGATRIDLTFTLHFETNYTT